MINSLRNKNLGIILETFFIILVFISSSDFVQAQSTEQKVHSKNCVFSDGVLALYSQVSINYERQIYTSGVVRYNIRFGGGLTQKFWRHRAPGGLVALTRLTGKENNHFELTAGAFIGRMPGFVTYETIPPSTIVHPILNIGYRYQKPEGGFVFRSYAGILGLGVSLGYAF